MQVVLFSEAVAYMCLEPLAAQGVQDADRFGAVGNVKNELEFILISINGWKRVKQTVYYSKNITI